MTKKISYFFSLQFHLDERFFKQTTAGVGSSFMSVELTGSSAICIFVLRDVHTINVTKSTYRHGDIVGLVHVARGVGQVHYDGGGGDQKRQTREQHTADVVPAARSSSRSGREKTKQQPNVHASRSDVWRRWTVAQ